MPAWIHDRADHLMRKNPGMAKDQAFAIATQQSHAAGKTPKGYGTAEGRREAKQKYDKPKREYVQTADPKSKTAAMLYGFCDELEKIAMMMVPKTNLPKNHRPGATSVPREPSPPTPMTDQMAATKMAPPPPVTAGR